MLIRVANSEIFELQSEVISNRFKECGKSALFTTRYVEHVVIEIMFVILLNSYQ